MELISSGSPEYKLILSEYNQVIYNITRDKSYTKFIGGLPITLERKDIYTIMTKDLRNNFNYSITQKADGTRFLLFTSYKLQSGKRSIVFIDRSNNFFILKNNKGEILPNFNGPRLLLDGELICYNAENKHVSLSDNIYDHKSFSFLVFDILYGPSTIEIEGPPEFRRLTVGNEVAMCGPVGGKLWPYTRRYDILWNLIYPLEINNYKPLISFQLKDTKWFIPEIKPLYFMNILHTKDILYQNRISEEGKQQKEGLFQIYLKTFRSDFYAKINEMRKENESDTVEQYNIKLDGLIFTPFNTEYVIGGAWKKFMNIQFKWKPAEEQTIDFEIFNSNKENKYNPLLLYVSKFVSIKVKVNEKYTELNQKIKEKNELIIETEYDNELNSLNIISILEEKDLSNVTTIDSAQSIISKNKNEKLLLLATIDKSGGIIINAKSNQGFYPLNVKELVPFYLNISKQEYAKFNVKQLNNKLREIGIKKSWSSLIGEFKFNTQSNVFELLNLRLDKTEPNSINTATNVFKAIRFPVDLNKTKEFFLLSKLNQAGLKKLMNYLTPKQLARLALKCGFSHNKLKLLSPTIESDIKENLNKFKMNNSYEFEIRLGYIEPQRFQTRIPLTLYQQFNDLLMSNRIPYEINEYKDYISGDYRSRYLYLQDLKNYVHLASIKKEKIENITYDTNYLFNLDMRFSLSNEKELNIESNPEFNLKNAKEDTKIFNKKRTTYKMGIVNIDCTETSEESINTDKLNKTQNAGVSYSIEIELLDRTKNIDIIIYEISKLLINILNQINS